MMSSNVKYDIEVSFKCFDDNIIPLKKINIIQFFYLINGGFLLIQSHESTATNKISKTLLRRSLYKVK